MNAFATSPAPLLDVRDINVHITQDHRTLDAVSHMSFDIAPQKILALVGESGCGKSLTAKALLRLTPENAHISGKVIFQQQDILTLPEEAIRRIRGKHISMIFQEPMTALNPVLRVGQQVMEPIFVHMDASPQEAEERCQELLHSVGIASPKNRMREYPHQLSGGMRQRVMIAMALVCQPDILLADEPTTALDVTIQGQILALLQQLIHEHGMSILLITHNLGVVAQVADAVGVMYAGHMVEYADVHTLFSHPLHPYTQGLMHSASTHAHMTLHRLPTIMGSVPSLAAMPQGCRFHPRCPHCMPCCKEQAPHLTGEGRKVRCWLHTQ